METFPFFFILIVTFVISTITLLAGFGLGTILTPVVALLYDAKTAVVVVALVHFSNNVLKFGLFFRHVDRHIFMRFGVLSFAGAALGALLFGLADEHFLRRLLGILLVAMGASDFFPSSSRWRIPQRFDAAGGFLSGLMGGLIGNQGAIRSAYLLNYNLSKEAFIATATAISLVIDLTRIPLYVWREANALSALWINLFPVALAAVAGTVAGRELLKKLSLERFRLLVAACVVGMGVAFLFT